MESQGKPLTEPLGPHDGRYACCPKARRLAIHCVCAVVVTCPDHGTRHCGTHD